ncbi:MAG: hypothetical protein HY534_03715 [Chloroflexi bacterium]|nr:hypothetical protein [Chloroflexota bacterium]
MHRIPEHVSVKSALAKLIGVDSRGVLSVYLNTSPDRVAGEAWRISYKNQCRDARCGLPEPSVAAFDRAAAEVLETLETSSLGAPGRALFLSEEPEFFYSVSLPSPPKEVVAWGTAPRLEALQRAADDFERFGVVLLDKERARLFTVVGAKIEVSHSFEDDVPGKQATGGWAALAQSRYARHREERVRRHVARAIAALETLNASRPFRRWFLGGSPEAVARFQNDLPPDLRETVRGELHLELFASDADVLGAALAASETAEREFEHTKVDNLLESTSRSTLGVDLTVEATEDRRVGELVVADSFDSPGGVCRTCDRLVPARRQCPLCGGEPDLVPDFRQRLLDRALRLGAAVEIVSGAAADKLMEHGGVGSWTRF